MDRHKANQARWYQENKELTKARTKARREREEARCREYVRKLKTETPCLDCKRFFHFAAMDFDHVRGKKLNEVSKLMNGGEWVKMLAEIEKCDLVCACCHRVRTYNRLPH